MKKLIFVLPFLFACNGTFGKIVNDPTFDKSVCVLGEVAAKIAQHEPVTQAIAEAATACGVTLADASRLWESKVRADITMGLVPQGQ